MKCVCPHNRLHPAHGGVEDAHQEDDLETISKGNSDTGESKTLHCPYLKCVCPNDCLHPSFWGAEDGTRKRTGQTISTRNSDTSKSKTLRCPYLKGVYSHDCFHPTHWVVEDAHQEDDQAGNIHWELWHWRIKDSAVSLPDMCLSTWPPPSLPRRCRRCPPGRRPGDYILWELWHRRIKDSALSLPEMCLSKWPPSSLPLRCEKYTLGRWLGRLYPSRTLTPAIQRLYIVLTFPPGTLTLANQRLCGVFTWNVSVHMTAFIPPMEV